MTSTRSFAVAFIVSMALIAGDLIGHFGERAWFIPLAFGGIVGLISIIFVLNDILSGSVRNG